MTTYNQSAYDRLISQADVEQDWLLEQEQSRAAYDYDATMRLPVLCEIPSNDWGALID